jgi:hypothetical protein
MINLDLEKHITQQIEQTVKTYLSSEELRAKMIEQVDNSIGKIIESVANRVYSEIVNRTQIADHIKTIVNLEASNAIQKESMEVVRAELSKTPVKQIIENAVKNNIDLGIKSFNFPEKSISSESINWKIGSLNGSYLKGGIIQNFSSTGIEDKSKNVQLTILDDHVVAEGQFTAMNITAADTVTAQNLVLTGSLEIGTEIIDHGPFSQMIQMHANMIVDDQLQPYAALLKDGKSLLNENSLAPSVTNSNLRKVGNLLELIVSGDAKFSETMFVSAGNKVGINTEEPRGALTVWDEDAEFTLMRTKRRTIFAGSSRDCELELGVNSQANIVIKEKLVDVTTPIRVMGIKFSVSNNVPEHSGEPNEIVMNSSARNDQPLFYICNGGNRWQTLKVSR